MSTVGSFAGAFTPPFAVATLAEKATGEFVPEIPPVGLPHPGRARPPCWVRGLYPPNAIRLAPRWAACRQAEPSESPAPCRRTSRVERSASPLCKDVCASLGTEFVQLGLLVAVQAFKRILAAQHTQPGRVGSGQFIRRILNAHERAENLVRSPADDILLVREATTVPSLLRLSRWT